VGRKHSAHGQTQPHSMVVYQQQYCC
jgi:hypothetical protein